MTTPTLFPWPTDVPRIFGASVAAIHESAHYYRRARHARPAAATRAASKRLEHARDMKAAGCATDDETFAVAQAAGVLV